jgi:hypothetical protein
MLPAPLPGPRIGLGCAVAKGSTSPFAPHSRATTARRTAPTPLGSPTIRPRTAFRTGPLTALGSRSTRCGTATARSTRCAPTEPMQPASRTVPRPTRAPSGRRTVPVWVPLRPADLPYPTGNPTCAAIPAPRERLRCAFRSSLPTSPARRRTGRMGRHSHSHPADRRSRSHPACSSGSATATRRPRLRRRYARRQRATGCAGSVRSLALGAPAGALARGLAPRRSSSGRSPQRACPSPEHAGRVGPLERPAVEGELVELLVGQPPEWPETAIGRLQVLEQLRKAGPALRTGFELFFERGPGVIACYLDAFVRVRRPFLAKAVLGTGGPSPRRSGQPRKERPRRPSVRAGGGARGAPRPRARRS